MLHQILAIKKIKKFHSLCLFTAYRTSDGQPYILPAVSKAKDRITENPSQNHEYRVVFGTEAFRQKSMALLLGEDSPAIKENRAHGIQTLSGTGALRLGAEFLFRTSNCKTVYISDPTWGELSEFFFIHFLILILGKRDPF